MDAFKKLWREACEFIINGFANISDNTLSKDANEIKAQCAKYSSANADKHRKLKIRAHLTVIPDRKPRAVIGGGLCVANKSAICNDFNRKPDG